MGNTPALAPAWLGEPGGALFSKAAELMKLPRVLNSPKRNIRGVVEVWMARTPRLPQVKEGEGLGRLARDE